MLQSNPELYAYFYENAPMPKDPKEARRIIVSAEYKLDMIDFFFYQADYINSQDDEFRSWGEYFKESFRNSQVLCSVLRNEQYMYGPEVNVVAHLQHCNGIRVSDEQIRGTLKKFFHGKF